MHGDFWGLVDRRSTLQAVDGNLMLSAEFQDFFPFEEQGFPSLDADGEDARFGASLDGLRADDRDIEAEVLVGFGNFHEDGFLIASQLAAAADAGVGALEGLDGEHGAVGLEHGLEVDQPGGLLLTVMKDGSDLASIKDEAFCDCAVKGNAWRETFDHHAQPAETPGELTQLRDRLRRSEAECAMLERAVEEAGRLRREAEQLAEARLNTIKGLNERLRAMGERV
jgi:hypothetical protein